MHTLTIIRDPFDPSKTMAFQTDDVIASLQQQFAAFPETGRLYCGHVCKENDVTPKCQKDVDILSDMEGDFTAVIYAGFGIDLIYYAYALLAVVAIVAITTRPKIPNSTSRNYQSQSPNNALSGRTNTQRVNARIPDIFGTVRSTPDLLAVPYSVFIDNVEFEYCYMCIGRGTYAIDAADVRDGQTAVSLIDGESVEVFGPNTSPNTGSTPQLRIGTAITRLVISVSKSKSVNGQTLVATNDSVGGSFNMNNLVTFEWPNRIVAPSPTLAALAAFTTNFTVGENMIVQTASVSGGDNSAAGRNLAFDNLSQSSSVPRGVQCQSDRIVFTDPSFLANLYLPRATFDDLGNEHDIAGVGPGRYIEIASLPITIGGVAHNLSGKYLASSDDASTTIFLVNPADVNPAWALVTGSEAVQSALFADTSSLTVNFSCNAEILSVTDTLITLATPQCYLACGSWYWASTGLLNFNGGDASYGSDGDSVTLGIGTDDPEAWVGPFVLDVITMTQIIANFVAENGMYKDDGSEQLSTTVDIQIGVTPCTSLGVATGGEIFFTTTVTGSDSVQSTRAETLFADLPYVGRAMVRARRLTPKDLTFVGTVVDEVKWRDLYASSPVGAVAFGDVTTVHAVTQATQTALAISERQLNMLVTRMVKQWNGSAFPDLLVATNAAADIMSHVCLDPKIGNRQAAEINFQNFYDVMSLAQAYFGIEEATEFCYTFDTDNISFEETITSIAATVFCQVQRRGQVIEIQLERQNSDALLLFNHRNKMPSTETRTTSFGFANNNDGIELDYVSPIDDAVVTYYVPEDRTAVNPKKPETIGVRNDMQAKLQAYREFNKLLYQNRSIQFDALEESNMVSIGNRVLVADNTRPDTQDGEVISQDGLTLTLSQPMSMITGVAYLIFLQMPSGIVDAISCIAGDSVYTVLLSEAPAEDLVLGESTSVKTIFQLIKATDNGAGNNRGYLITDKSPQSNFINTMTVVNYDDRYYQNDHDFGGAN